MKGKLLIIDDDQVFCKMLTEHFREEYDVVGFSDPQEAVLHVREKAPDVVLTDLNMPGLDGMEVLRAVKSESPMTDVIIMTAFAQVENAVEAMKMGAYDYIIKPLTIDDLSLHLKNLFEKRRLFDENAHLREFVDSTYRPESIIGTSAAVTGTRTFIEKASMTDFPVLILGENGVGKEHVARAVHFSGKRKSGKFLLVHCSEFSQELLERELFGYEAGAFPDLRAGKKGLLEEVGGGTLMLAEIDEMSLYLQARLFGALDRSTFKRFGNATVETDFCGRVIASADKDLRELVREGNFREDLFYRLNMFSLKIPPLRDRREDISDLVKYYFSLYREEFGRNKMALSKEALDILVRYNWPGNVNELKGLLAKVCMFVDADSISPGHILAKLDFPDPLEQFDASSETARSLSEVEKKIIKEALMKTDGNVARAAKQLNISYDTLRYRIKKFGIKLNRE